MSTTRVLVVDDAVAVRRLLRVALNGLREIEMAEAGDGAEALRMLAASEYELVLLDLNMPTLDGWKVLSWLQARTVPVPKVIVISTMGDPETVKRAVAQGASGVLAKPLHLHDVRREVRATLGLEPVPDLMVELDEEGRPHSDIPPPDSSHS